MIRFSLGNLDVEQVEAIRTLQRQSNLAEIDNRCVPTGEFLTSMAAMLAHWWNCAVTPTQAWQVWIGADRVQTSIAKAHRTNAEIGFWYGIDPYSLSQNEIHGLHANLARVRAQQRLELGNYDPYDFQQVYDLTMQAYDDDSIAVAARAASMKMLVARDTRR